MSNPDAPWWRKLLCFVSVHEWRTYEEAVALNTCEACKHCVGWRFARISPQSPGAKP